ncbi:MAG: ABC transporter ATP-binding protein [Phyllobacterium sp.]
MLEIRELNVYRGNTHVLKDISFDVRQGETIALIGANGAGKTTTLQTLSGLLRPRSGHARMETGGKTIDLTRSRVEKIVRAGLIHCPEGRQIFQSLSVSENLAMGAYSCPDRASIPATMAEVHRLFPILKERAGAAGGTLSGGEQMMLAIARALLAMPKLLLLDEPSLGLAPKFVERIFDVIEALNETGVTILLVEQNAAMALDVADRAYVLENGRIVLTGTGKELAENEQVRKAYLGGLE